MKLLKNKFLIGSVCIIIGLLVGFLGIPQIQVRDKQNLVQAVRLTQDIRKGEIIAETQVEVVSLEQSLLPVDTLTSLSFVANRYAAADLFAGDYLTIKKLADEKQMPDPMKLATAKGLTIVSVTLPSLTSGVSGKLQPGDVVTIMGLLKNTQANQTQLLKPLPQSGENQTDPNSEDSEQPDPGSDNQATVTQQIQTRIYPELRYLEVCSLSASDGSQARVSPNPDNENKNLLPLTISLFATEEQALRLAELEQKGLIHLSFVARGNDVLQFISSDIRVLNTEVN
jgi:pilus assembly protein CpaB